MLLINNKIFCYYSASKELEMKYFAGIKLYILKYEMVVVSSLKKMLVSGVKAVQET